ncbi:RHS repeat-associated core domain-containing protein [Acidovorax sp. NB1]|uniref:RHS repeat-associated core domain-containing protein n=1 Tax=Acidovorax sp. NB1 TaxID=1943571 RepID=UPI0010DD6044|nr:RHS repeat-associated core domain-containing protein [Acidovorax sp. NB1]GDY36529.1 hypothetical protein ACINB_24210 [Acidovorax sp. NB1]
MTAMTETRTPRANKPDLIQQLLNFFFSKLWSPATSDAEKLGWTYVYAEDGSLLAEYGEGSAATSGSAQYLWLPTANGPMPIAAVVNGQTYAVHSDHLNTPRKLTQANGQAVWQWAYSAFGDEQPTTAAKRFTSEMTNPTTGATSIPDVTFNLRYPGQYFDKETGLHYNYFRTYAPGTGRYTQPDPIGLDGGWNRFAYVGGNPLSSVDTNGLQPALPIPAPPPSVVPPGGSTGSPGYMPVPDLFKPSPLLPTWNWGGVTWPNWMGSRRPGGVRNDPVILPPVNPGRDCDGKCNPCPPGARWFVPRPGHGHENGYWKEIRYNQDPTTCMCYPDRPSQGLEGM